MDFPKSVPGVGLVDGKFVDENQATGQVGSLIPSAWGNAVTEELLNVIQAAGLEPDEEQNDQLLKAIRRLSSTYLAKDVAGAADVVLSEAEAQSAVIKLTGAITANINIIVPDRGRDWVFINATTGAFTVTVKTQLGAGVAVTPASPLHLYCDGAAVGAVGASGTQKQIQPVSALAAANALTLTLGATSLDFRSSSLNSGTVNTRAISAPLSLVIPSGATLGTANGVAARLALLAIDNAGTVELAVVNMAGSVNLDESSLISTTAISAGAGSAGVIYSATARASVPFRVVGYFDVTQATAGVWANAPTTTQGRGGLAANMTGLGVGQTWQNVTASRTGSTNYTNTTGRPIFVNVYTSQTMNNSIAIDVDGVRASYESHSDSQSGATSQATAIVPAGSVYSVAGNINVWMELR